MNSESTTLWTVNQQHYEQWINNIMNTTIFCTVNQQYYEQWIKNTVNIMLRAQSTIDFGHTCWFTQQILQCPLKENNRNTELAQSTHTAAEPSATHHHNAAADAVPATVAAASASIPCRQTRQRRFQEGFWWCDCKLSITSPSLIKYNIH